MMKKIFCVFTATMLLVSLAACGSSDGGASADFSPDLAAFGETLFQGEDAPMMMPIEDAETLEMLYPGLNDIERKQTVILMAAISAVAAEAAMVEVENAGDVEAVQEVFQARIDAQVGTDDEPGGAWYPETIEVWKNSSEIVTRGNCVCLFVGEAKDDMVSAFLALE